MALKIRRGTNAERIAGGGVIFAEGELVYVTDTDALYIGDGVTAGGVFLTNQAFGTISNFIVADTIADELKLQKNLNLNNNNIIGIGNINLDGNIVATGNIDIGDNTGDTVTITAQVDSNITPTTDTVFDLGSNSLRWRNVYASGLTVSGQIDAVSINANTVANDSTVMVNVATNTFTGDFNGNLSGNVTGDVTGNTAGFHTGDVKGSVFGDDSTPLVDAVAGVLRGNHIGTLTGNVLADNGVSILSAGTNGANANYIGTVQGNVTGNLSGNVTGDVVGDLTGNTTGFHTGDVKGSVFGDDSSPIVDAVSNQVRATGGFIGDVTGDVTGNVITSLIDSSDSSEIVVVPSLRTLSNLTVEQDINVGNGGNVIRNDGSLTTALLEVATITDNGFGSISIDTTIELSGGITSPGLGRFLDTVDILWLNDSVGKNLIVQKFTGDPESDSEIQDPNNYNVYAQIDDSKAAFGVPIKFPVVADDTARSALVPTPEKGMVILMEAGTAPSATNQLQYFNGSNWVNV